MIGWEFVTALTLLLFAALCLGVLAHELRQSTIIGALIAGMLLGPYGIGVFEQPDTLVVLGELGACLLLFSIGLELTPAELKTFGRRTLIAGGLQIGITLLLTIILCKIAGLSKPEALAIAAMLSLSSTACVIRTLTQEGGMDSSAGRSSLGVLLVQDAAIVPLSLLVTLSGSSGGVGTTVWKLALGSVVFFGALWFLSRHVLVRVMKLSAWHRDRDLGILLSLVLSLGSALVAHTLGLPPALGSFVAGVFLANSPLAVQVRSDVATFRAALVTIFFAIVGMFGSLAWMYQHIGMVLLFTVGCLALKSLAAYSAFRISGEHHRNALGASLMISQIGEFSFVIGGVARATGLISEEHFQLFISVSLLSIILTPKLVTVGLTIASQAESSGKNPHQAQPADLVVIGYGPCGAQIVDAACKRKIKTLVIERNLNQEFQPPPEVEVIRGDALSEELLRHAHLDRAQVVVVTIPDTKIALNLIELVRSLAPSVTVMTRGRYHRSQQRLTDSGAAVVVDEETIAGQVLSLEAITVIEKHKRVEK